MLFQYNAHDISEKYPGVFYKNILSADAHQIPFNVSIIRISPANSTTLHNHHDTEFFTILSGEGEIKINRDSHTVRPGDILYVKPFDTHIITNISLEHELVFTTCWWFIPAQIQKLIENDIKKRQLLPEITTIMTSFPTPNGPLHLGHLSGPFIAADVYARFLKQHGKKVFTVCGLDQNQTWCGIDANDTITYSAQIKNALSNIQVYSDFFIEPIENKQYTYLTQDIFSDLVDKGLLFKKIVSVFICEKTGKYLADSEIISSCPNCKAKIRGNNCEQCFLFINDANIIDPQQLNSNAKVSTTQKECVYFSLSRYQELIKEFINSSILNSNLKQICLRLLEKPLPDIPVTHYYPWGIPLERNEFSGQYICYYFEHVTRLLYALKHANIAVDCSKNKIVRFFGIDNVFMNCLFAPALVHALHPLLLPRLASNANQYYLLDNQKFSTSRKHFILADEFIEKWGSDMSRFYLAYTRPEDSQSNFNHVDFINFCNIFQHEWQDWLIALFGDIKSIFDAKIPEAGSWDLFQENYFSMLQKSVTEASNFLLLGNFSTVEYAHILLEIARRAGRLRKKYTLYKESEDLKAYYRTAIALQVSTAHVLAIISWPLIPNFANKLYISLGFQNEPILGWTVLPQLLPPGQAILNFPIFSNIENDCSTL